MGAFNFIILATVSLAIASSLFFGFVSIAKKSMKPAQHSTIDSDRMLSDQKQHMDDIERRQKDLMRQQKQKMEDMKRMQHR
jgi:hypothetical protein